MPMRTDIAPPIRLTDYRPPDWLVETVHLDVTLHPSAADVVVSCIPWSCVSQRSRSLG